VSLWLALIAGAGMIFFLAKSRWNYTRLPELQRSEKEGRPDVSIVIPARNEESNIQRVVRTLSRSRVYVVDDESTDQTAIRARRAGATAIPVPSLPPKSVGKPHACWIGAQSTTSRWLLFVDADTWYEPGFVDSLIDYATSESLDMASVFLRQECVTAVEKMLLPYSLAIYFCGVSAAAAVSPARREALANGQCLLFRREAYKYVGGHVAVMGSVIDDMDLAHIAKRHGMKVRVLRAEKLGSVRVNTGWRSIKHGFRRKLFRVLLANPWSCAQVILASSLLVSYLPILVYLGIQAQWMALSLFAALPIVLLRPWYGTWFQALAVPAAIYGLQYVALRAMVATVFKRPVEWKGRRF